MWNRNIETFIGCDKEYAESSIVLFGAPFDSTTSYRPGARFGPKSIRSESYGIETYSPYQNKSLEDIAVFDNGDLELCIGNAEITLQQIESFADKIAKDQKMSVMLGGEHLVTLAVIRAMIRLYPDLHIIHFDAHADLRDDYLGAKLSHAAVLRRVWELTGEGKIHQFGIRSGDKSEFEWGINHVFTQKFNFDDLEDTVKKLKGKPVYFTLDLDVLDPAVFPGTGTPEAGGVSFQELLTAIQSISSLNLVAFDMVELAPNLDQSGASTAVACKILREMLLAFNKR